MNQPDHDASELDNLHRQLEAACRERDAARAALVALVTTVLQAGEDAG